MNSSSYDFKQLPEYKKIAYKHSTELYNAKEASDFHNTYLFEQRYLHLIQEGNTEGLKKLFTEIMQAPGLKEGSIGDNALRQSKNIFISNAALVTRAAIAGGLACEIAYQLSDVYINVCERLGSVREIQELQFALSIDFAERVETSKMPAGMSLEVFECVQFITQNTNASIQVSDVANHIHRSVSYTTRKFKEELGFGIRDFIMRCKLEEAKSLLSFTDKSLSEISSYLCFSSQSYFQNVFKKKYGVTPLQFRKGK